MTDFNKIRYRAVIEFLTLENVPSQQIYNRMTVVYGECAPSYVTVKRWTAEFRQGRNSLEGESRSGRPSEAVCEENCRAVENTVLQNRRVNVQLIANAVFISTGSVKIILREHLLMKKVCVHWVPRMLDQKMKDCRYELSSENLKLMQLDWNLFLKRIITGDETWIYHYDPEPKQQSMQWKHASSPSPRKFKVQASASKIMYTVFWDAEGILLIDFMPQKVTITWVYYADLLHRLRLAIKEKRRGKLTKVPFCTTMHLLTGHMLYKLLYLNLDLKKCITHHILLTWHRVIIICFQIWSNTSVYRDFRPMMSLSMLPKSGWRSSQNSFISQALGNFDNAINCALTKAVITLNNKCIHINLSLLYIG